MAKTIITLGREYCTGGRYIAEDVANALGIKLYDKELITMAAKHSGLSEEAVAASEKRHTHSLLYSLYTCLLYTSMEHLSFAEVQIYSSVSSVLSP